MKIPLFPAALFSLAVLLAAGRAADPIPVIFDTDIGGDIDDVYALAQIVKSPELKLLGVTTVSGDTAARARLAAKFLAVGGRTDIPVYAGIASKADYLG
ncbi:MAG: nucleoside hydrolase, partial [Oleiharenicola lentus]